LGQLDDDGRCVDGRSKNIPDNNVTGVHSVITFPRPDSIPST
jgi:hypothetical protein